MKHLVLFTSSRILFTCSWFVCICVCMQTQIYMFNYKCPFVHACMQRSEANIRCYSSDTILCDYCHSISHWPKFCQVGLAPWPKILTNSLISASPARSYTGNDQIWLFILLFGSNSSSHTYKAKHRLRQRLILPS